jgi:hypothetical protein
MTCFWFVGFAAITPGQTLTALWQTVQTATGQGLEGPGLLSMGLSLD